MSQLDGSEQVLTKAMFQVQFCRFINIIIQTSVPIYPHYVLSDLLYALGSFLFLHVCEGHSPGWPPMILICLCPCPCKILFLWSWEGCDLCLTGYRKGDGMSHVFHNHMRLCLAVDFLWSVLVFVAWISQQSCQDRPHGEELCLGNVSSCRSSRQVAEAKDDLQLEPEKMPGPGSYNYKRMILSTE